MGTSINLTISDDVYRRAKQVARKERRSVADVLNEALSQAFPAVHVNANRDTMEVELKAYGAMSDELLDKYFSQYVAIHKGSVVDSDEDRLALVARIDERFPDQVVLIRQVTSDGDTVLNISSPRLIR